jgi:hypothetical protein
MSLLDRFRRLFGSQPAEPDHPLTEAERQDIPQTARDEAAGLIGEFADPDANDPR